MRLVILWLLSEQPHHGYRMKKILQDEGLRTWFPIEDASIYSMLRTLVKSGYARQMEAERQGKRPRRTPYAITKKGRRHYEELLRRAWRDPASRTDPVQLCLASSGDLAEEEVDELIRERLERLRERSEQLGRLRRSAPAAAMVDRERARVEGELGWLRSFAAERGDHNVEQGDRSMAGTDPQIDLICNVVIRRDDGSILLARYDTEHERWWLPTRSLVPYQHPDEVAPLVLADLGGLTTQRIAFSEIESFRGRSGWHVMFNYVADVDGEPDGKIPSRWFPPEQLPSMAHGTWEKGVIRRALERH